MRSINNRTEKRTREISIKVTGNELKKLHERRGNIKLARYLRNLGLGALAIKKADNNLVRELGCIGSNLNQVAKHVDTNNELDHNVLSDK